MVEGNIQPEHLYSKPRCDQEYLLLSADSQHGALQIFFGLQPPSAPASIVNDQG